MTVALWQNLSRETDRVSGPELRRYMRMVVIAVAAAELDVLRDDIAGVGAGKLDPSV